MSESENYRAFLEEKFGIKDGDLVLVREGDERVFTAQKAVQITMETPSVHEDTDSAKAWYLYDGVGYVGHVLLEEYYDEECRHELQVFELVRDEESYTDGCEEEGREPELERVETPADQWEFWKHTGELPLSWVDLGNPLECDVRRFNPKIDAYLIDG